MALKAAVEKKVYPGRLFPIAEEEKRKWIEIIYYLRHYSVCSLILLFFIFSFVGWGWEVSLHLITDGTFVNRGVLHGTVAPHLWQRRDFDPDAGFTERESVPPWNLC